MPLCLIAGDMTVRIAVASFVLAWPDPSLTDRREQSWSVSATQLQLQTEHKAGDVLSSGPVVGAVWDRGWWRWVPKRAPMTKFVLTASEAEMRTLCVAVRGCSSIPELLPGPTQDVTFKVCP